ncbi:MAG TPA: histidine phosphatase family protein [Acidimicrobiales bacterium]|nr:histidine phosphatase family protein [Acidimicrobiales bacterium]
MKGEQGARAGRAGFDGLSGARPSPGPPPGVATVRPAGSGPAPTRLVLVRHGEAVCNVTGVCGGVVGCGGLTDVGRRQVEELRDRLARSGELAGCQALYASVLGRARQSAEILAPAVGRRAGEVRARCDLCELHPGEADGLGWAEFVERFGEPDWDADPDRPIAPGGESWTGFVRRVSLALDELVAAHPAALVVAVCHAGVVEASLLAKLPVAGAEDGVRLGLPTRHASMTTWEVEDGRWRLFAYNDAAGVPVARASSRAGRPEAGPGLTDGRAPARPAAQQA